MLVHKRSFQGGWIYYFLIHVHVPWRIITRSNGGPGSFEYYFNGGKILCVYMYIGDYFYR